MSRSVSRVVVVLGAVAAGALAWTLAGRSPAAPPAGVRAWEYRVLNEFQVNGLGRQPPAQGGPVAERQPFAEGINGLGADGWELVTVVVTGNAAPTYCFKRPK
jgi:hypothetical protein